MYPQPVLSLFASGRQTGLVFDCGDSPYSHAVPVKDGYAVRKSITRLGLAGCHVTEFMIDILNTERGHYSISTQTHSQIVRDIKDKLCYVAIDFDKEIGKVSTDQSIEKAYKLPDGQIVKVSNERFRCPEALFQPNLIGMQIGGIHQFINQSIADCDDSSALRKELYANILLTGGTTFLPGINERLQKELTTLAPSVKKIKILSPIERQYSAWRGGSLIASMPAFNKMCITKEEYDEHGPSIVHQKCL